MKIAISDEQDLRALERAEDQLQAAVAANDPMSLAAVLHDDLLATGPDGLLVSKQEDIAGYLSGDFRVARYEQIRRRVIACGGTGVTAVRAHIRGQMKDGPFDVVMDYTRTWVFDEGRWQVLAAHLSLVPEA
jgi:ketosteroid isomerase-like protein